MTWKVRAQFNRPPAEMSTDNCEWNAVMVNTQSEAETWWNCRTAGRTAKNVVHTMFDPSGNVVRVAFN